MSNTKKINFYFNDVDSFANSLGIDNFLKTIRTMEKARANIEDRKMQKKIEQKTYLIKNNRNGLVKIGKSVNPNTRLKTLQGEDPYLEILHIINKDVEKHLHKKFKSKRKLGEWFKLTIKDIKNIKNDKY